MYVTTGGTVNITVCMLRENKARHVSFNHLRASSLCGLSRTVAVVDVGQSPTRRGLCAAIVRRHVDIALLSVVAPRRRFPNPSTDFKGSTLLLFSTSPHLTVRRFSRVLSVLKLRCSCVSSFSRREARSLLMTAQESTLCTRSSRIMKVVYVHLLLPRCNRSL